MDIERVKVKGETVLYIECPVCHNRVFMTDGYPVSGAEAEKELRVGFEAHVKDHKARSETPRKVRHR